jgi:hypothetical protein
VPGEGAATDEIGRRNLDHRMNRIGGSATVRLAMAPAIRLLFARARIWREAARREQRRRPR